MRVTAQENFFSCLDCTRWWAGVQSITQFYILPWARSLLVNHWDPDRRGRRPAGFLLTSFFSSDTANFIPNAGPPLLLIAQSNPFLIENSPVGLLSILITLLWRWSCCDSCFESPKIWSRATNMGAAAQKQLEMGVNICRLSHPVFHTRIIIPQYVHLYGLASDPCNLNDFSDTVCGTCLTFPLRQRTIIAQRRLLNCSIT